MRQLLLAAGLVVGAAGNVAAQGAKADDGPPVWRPPVESPLRPVSPPAARSDGAVPAAKPDARPRAHRRRKLRHAERDEYDGSEPRASQRRRPGLARL